MTGFFLEEFFVIGMVLALCCG
ncbi:MAG: hypothetical protein CFH37_01664, partial [Alphaproteobacteria bacterium MarineAlpha9_Bin7]